MVSGFAPRRIGCQKACIVEKSTGNATVDSGSIAEKLHIQLSGRKPFS